MWERLIDAIFKVLALAILAVMIYSIVVAIIIPAMHGLVRLMG